MHEVSNHLPWHEKVQLWWLLFAFYLSAATSPVCPPVHRIKSTPVDGHVPLNQHADKLEWKRVNLNGLVKLAWVLIAHQPSECSSCHEKWASLLKPWERTGYPSLTRNASMWGAVGQWWKPTHQRSLRPQLKRWAAKAPNEYNSLDWETVPWNWMLAAEGWWGASLNIKDSSELDSHEKFPLSFQEFVL